MLKFRFNVYLFFWIILLIFFASVIYFQMDNYFYYAKEEERIKQLIAEEERTSQSLLKELQDIGSDAFIEKIAREQLGLVSIDEILFYRE